MTLNADPRDYDFEPWDDAYDDDRPTLLDRLSGNTGMIAGVLTVVVTFSVVAANALFYQPHAHQGAMFNTRDVATQAVEQAMNTSPQKSLVEEAATIPKIEPAPTKRKVSAEEAVAIDTERAKLRLVQTVLKDLAIYTGKVDGLNGPQTRAAIAAYQKVIGLPQTGAVDASLLAQLTGNALDDNTAIAQETNQDSNLTVASITPTPRPKPQDDVAALIGGAKAPQNANAREMVKQLQAGLRLFDNPDIVVDGVHGSETTAALKLFQETFHLKVTGQPNEAVFQKMRDLGYIN